MDNLVKDLINLDFNVKDFVVVCIGTKKSFLDSVGPMIGTILKDNIPDIYVYGQMDNNCHALNIESIIERIKVEHPNKKILAIDSCLTSDNKKVGTFELKQGAIYPGAGVGKNLPKVGDYSIRAFVLEKENKSLITNNELIIHKRCDEYVSYVSDIVCSISMAIVKANEYYIKHNNINISVVESFLSKCRNKLRKIIKGY